MYSFSAYDLPLVIWMAEWSRIVPDDPRNCVLAMPRLRRKCQHSIQMHNHVVVEFQEKFRIRTIFEVKLDQNIHLQNWNVIRAMQCELEKASRKRHTLMTRPP